MRKKDRELIEGLKKSVDNLNQSIDLNVISKSKKFDELRENLSKVRLKIKKANVRISEDGNAYVDVTYATTAKVYINDDLSTKSDEVFKAIALLDILSSEDIQRLTDEIAKAKEFAKNLK